MRVYSRAHRVRLFLHAPGHRLAVGGYLVTASPIAPVLAHVLSHATSLVHGA